MPASLYFGKIAHTRLRPFRHHFAYRVVSLYLDLDRLAEAGAATRLFSYNRSNLFSFFDHDHGQGDGPLRPWVDGLLRDGGLPPAHRVMLLCFPRLFGYVFNPLSIYFCFDASGAPVGVVHEVHNTFGQRHAYVIPVDGSGDPSLIHQQAPKRFYVSPFIGMDCTYRFRLRTPTERLSVVIRQADGDGELLVASHTAHRRPLSDRSLLRALLGYPLVTAKVIGAIHWQALRLWIKGARLQPRPPSAQAVTHVSANAGFLRRRPSPLHE